MKKMAIAMIFSLLIPFAALAASDGLAELAARITASATKDLGSFRARVSAEFGIGPDRVDAAIKAAGSAGEAYLCLQIGQKAQRPPEEVIRVYSTNKKKGWGYVAKEMGIKPGSKEFHELKDGKYVREEYGDGRKDKGDGHGNEDKGRGGQEMEGGKGKSDHSKGGKGK